MLKKLREIKTASPNRHKKNNWQQEEVYSEISGIY
jgi:hypothetical protein